MFIRLRAGISVPTMVVAYFGFHADNGLWPRQCPAEDVCAAPGGEAPILWFLVPGIIGVLGSRKWGLERAIFGRELL